MADQNIQIGITTTADTTGAKDTQAAIHAMDAEVARSANTIEQAAEGPLTEHAKRTKEAHVQTKNWGMATNALSYQFQDFSVQVGSGTSAVTAFAQQAPQLIDGLRMAGVLTGGMGMAMMGVSAAIPLLAFGGKALFEWLGKSEEKLNTSSKALDRYKDAVKVFKELEEAGSRDREEKSRIESDALRKQLNTIDLKYKIEGDANALAYSRQNFETQIAISHERLELARTEAALTTATGTEVLRLTKEREASIQRIYDNELKLSDIAREAAISAARTAIAKASDSQAAAKDANYSLAGRTATTSKEVEALQAQYDQMMRERQDHVEMLKSDLEAKKAQLAELQKNPSMSPEVAAANRADMQALQREIANLPKRIQDAETENAKNIADAIAARDAKQGTLDAMTKELQASNRALEAASKAMTDATLALTALKGTQAAQKAGEGELKADAAKGTAEKEIRDTGAKVTDSAKKAIDILTQQAKARGVSAEPGAFPGNSPSPEAEAIGRIKGIITDNKPDADQGNEIVAIVKQFVNASNLKDNQYLTGLNSLLAMVSGQVDQIVALKERIADLESKATQGR